MEYAGTLRIKEKNLSGQTKVLHDKLISEGWLYNRGCGRFTRETCTCSKCRKKSLNHKL